MKALRYYGKEDVRIEEVDEPRIRAGTVKIKPAFTGICGSDLHLFYDGPMEGMQGINLPHPISGRGGGLSEHIVVEERWVHPVGDMPLDQAALIEPLAVATQGVELSGGL